MNLESFVKFEILSNWKIKEIPGGEMNKKEALIKALNGLSLRAQDCSAAFTYDSIANEFLWDDGEIVTVSLLNNDTEYEVVKKTKKAKLYQYANFRGSCTDFFFTDDLKLCWNGHKLTPARTMNRELWKRTNCFIEVEIEI